MPSSRRLFATALGSLLLAAPVAAGATGTAHADPIFPEPKPSSKAPLPRPTVGSCSIIAPTAVPLGARRTPVQVTLGADCPTSATATWDVVAPTGKVTGRLTFPPAGTRTITLTATGTYTLRPVTAVDPTHHSLVQTGATVVAGARSRTVTAATRSGATVRVTATARAYSVATNTYVPRAKTRVVLQRAACASGCTWTTVATATTGRAGTAALTGRSARPAVWRTVTAGTPTVFGSVSTPFSR